MRTLLFYLYCAWELVINTIFNLNKVSKWKKENNKRKLDEFFVDKIYSKEVKNILNICGITLEVDGLGNIPNEGPLVFISNHQSNFDVITLVRTLNRRVGFIAKKELGKIPFLNIWMANMGCLFIDRENIKQSAKIITEAIDYIREGNAMMIFPEGTRSRSDNVGEFKSGSFKIAIKSGATIVPISISGSYKVMEANKGKIKPAKINIKYHKPIETKNMTKEELNELHNTVKGIIEEGVATIHNSQFTVHN